jgi:transcriptional regulator with XRE-family HTH domain
MTDLQYLKKFGANIKAARTNKGMTEAQLAPLAHMRTTTLQKIERGQAVVDLNRIMDLARALKLHPKNLI